MFKLSKKLLDALTLALYFFCLLAFFAVIRTNLIWGNVYFGQVLHIIGGVNFQAGRSFVIDYFWFAFLAAGILIFILPVLIKKKLYLLSLYLGCLFFSIYKLQVIPYLINQNTYSDLYAKEYVNPNNIDFSFPAKKRNLIVLYLESMEQDYLNPEVVGANLLPNLSKISAEGYSFNGFHQPLNQEYTIAAMVSGFCGIDYKTKPMAGFANLQTFLPDAVCYPQILQQNGYRNHFMKGASLDFTRTGLFFKTHGFESVIGESEIKNDFNIDLGSHRASVWGYNDSKLYPLAKQQLTEIAKSNQPFAFTMITLDTHEPDMHLDAQCATTLGGKKDIILCADKMAADFIRWVQSQDFYKNTTVIVMGDHPQTGNKSLLPNQKKRKIFNIILNAVKPAEHVLRQEWTTLDLAPTILNAIGVEFDQGKFGLGRSLYSDSPTLYEQMGNAFDFELLKASKEYALFEQSLYTSKASYHNYPQWGQEINTIDKISQYTNIFDTSFNVTWLDTLSFTLPTNTSENIFFDIWFRILFVEKGSRQIEIFANNQYLTTWELQPSASQPFHKTLKIPAEILQNKSQLLLEFKANNTGYTPITVGLGVDKFKLRQD